MSNEERKELKEELLCDTFMWCKYGVITGIIEAPHAELVTLKEKIEDDCLLTGVGDGSGADLEIEGDTLKFDGQWFTQDTKWLEELSGENSDWNIRCDVFLHHDGYDGYSLHRLENGVWFDYEFLTEEDEDDFRVISNSYYPYWKKDAPKVAVEIAENIGLDGEYWDAMCLDVEA